MEQFIDVKKEGYGLRLKSNGEPVYVQSTDRTGAYACNDVTYALIEDKYDGIQDCELWMLDSVDDVLVVLNNPTRYYNSSFNNPDHDFDVDEVEIVKLTDIKRVSVESIDIDLVNKYEETVLRVIYHLRNQFATEDLKLFITGGRRRKPYEFPDHWRDYTEESKKHNIKDVMKWKETLFTEQ